MFCSSLHQKDRALLHARRPHLVLLPYMKFSSWLFQTFSGCTQVENLVRSISVVQHQLVIGNFQNIDDNSLYVLAYKKHLLPVSNGHNYSSMVQRRIGDDDNNA